MCLVVLVDNPPVPLDFVSSKGPLPFGFSWVAELLAGSTVLVLVFTKKIAAIAFMPSKSNPGYTALTMLRSTLGVGLKRCVRNGSVCLELSGPGHPATSRPLKAQLGGHHTDPFSRNGDGSEQS